MAQTGKLPKSGIYLNQLMSTDDFAQSPIISNQLFRRYGQQYLTLMNILFSFGDDRPIGNSIFSAYEEDWWVGSFHNKYQINDPGPGNPVTIALSPQDIDSLGRVYPSAKYQILFPNRTMGYIDQEVDFSNPAEPTIHVRPVDITLSLGAIPAGLELSTHSIATGSGQYAAKGKTNSYTKRDFYAQQFHLQVEMDGEFIATKSWMDSFVEAKTKSGSFAYWSEALAKTEYMMKLMQDQAYWFGQELASPASAPVVPSTDPGAGNPIYFTKGLIPHAIDRGLNFPFTPGSLSLQDYYDWDSYLDAQGGSASADQLFFHGIDLSHEIDTLLLTELKNTQIDYTKKMAGLMMGEQDAAQRETLAADLHFNSLTTGSRTFHHYKYGLWSHPVLYPTASAYPNKTMGLIMPKGKFFDQKQGIEMPIISNCYRSANGLDRKYRFQIFSGPGAEVPGSTVIYETDITKALLFAHTGLRVMCANQLIFVNPAA